MFNVSDYLKKFARIEGDSLLQKDAVNSAIKESCGIDSTPFEIKKNVLYIKGSPVMKSIIYTKKLEILNLITKKDPKTKITDIR